MSKSSNVVDRHVGARVRMRRLMLRLSQTELGNAVGVTFQQVQKYESGTNRISASRLQQLASVLQVPPPFFFEDQSHQVGQPKTATAELDLMMQFLSTREGLALAKAFSSIREARLRGCIVDLVQQLQRRQ